MAGARLDVLSCTFFANEGAAIRAVDGAKVAVRRSILFGEGSRSLSSGIAVEPGGSRASVFTLSGNDVFHFARPYVGVVPDDASVAVDPCLLDPAGGDFRPHPDSPVVVHPECPPVVIEKADFVASTEGMVKLAAEHDSLIVGTEIGLVERLTRDFPGKKFYPLSPFAVCRNMKMIDLPRVVWSLDNEEHEIIVPDDVRIRAQSALARMLEC